MTKYREILRLKSLGYSERNIALCCCVSRNTVAKVCARAKELGITWPLAPEQTDKVLSKENEICEKNLTLSFENAISERKNYCKEKDARL